MSATLYLAPTTEAVLAHIVEHVRLVRRERPLAPLTFLLPSGDAIRQLRRTLGDVIGVRFHQFYNLGAAVLGEAGSATHEMSDLATRRLVRGILKEMHEAGQLNTFAPMLDKPGFLDVLVEWLREMKTRGIASEAVCGHASQSGKPRDKQLAVFYSRYQGVLQQADCTDADGLLWLAAESLERDCSLSAGMGELIVAGFDQFSPVQLRMVAALAAGAPVGVYLLWDAGRPASSLALGRLAPTRDALLRVLAPREVLLTGVDHCGTALAHVRKALFEPDGPAVVDQTASIAAIAAPSAEAEVRCALRQIKRLLLDGVREEQIVLVAPQPGTYRAIVRAVSREYGVPVGCETMLGENPCIAALMNLLPLAPAFPWRQTFDALRSPYVKQPWLDDEQIACLDALTRERPVVAGQDQWWSALGKCTLGECTLGECTLGKGEDLQAAEAEMPEDEDRADLPLLSQLEPEVLAALQTGLAAFFDHLTPPAEATHAGYVSWMQDALLGLANDPEPGTGDAAPLPPSLRIVQAASEGEWADRDRDALAVLLQALRGWLDAVALTAGLRLERKAGRVVTWDEFASELLEWLPAVPVAPRRSHAAIRFGPLEMNRAVTVEHLFVLGLGEGEFPREPQPDPFYTATERHAAARAAHPLPLVQVAGAEDASLWWQVLCNCQCSLTLLRSRYDANGAEWLPSPYWSAVVQLVEGLAGRVEKPKLGDRPGVEDAACHGELLEALACSRASGALASLDVRWNAVQAAQAVAGVRDGWGALGGHEGVVADKGVAAHLRSRYGPGQSWSLSRLSRYGSCPYAFWAQQALELEALADPSEGMDAMQRGSLIHKLLEKLFARLAAAGIAPGSDNLDPIRCLLDEVCDQVLPEASERIGFRPGPLWEHEQAELRAELHAYMAWECEPEQSAGFRPYLQELKFGMERGTARVAISGLDGATIALRGIIDRIDRDDAGHLRVIDYKSGSTKYADKDIAAGRALQTALYAWVVEAILPGEGVVVDSAYRHTGSRCQSGRIRSSSAHECELIRQAAAKAVSMAGCAAEGWFPAVPSKGSGARACDERCDYLGLCRVTRHAVRKAQRAGPPLVGQIPGQNADAGNDGGGGAR